MLSCWKLLLSGNSSLLRDGSTDRCIRGNPCQTLQGYGFRCVGVISEYWIAVEKFSVKAFRNDFQIVAILPRKDNPSGNAEMKISCAASNSDICPVLKHGPRSLTHVRVCGY